MTDTERCHAEQARAAAYLAENPQGPEARGARQGLADWMAEEILLMDKKMERHKELAGRYMREANGATWMDWIEDLLLAAEARIAELTADEGPRQAAERIVQSHLNNSTLTDEDLRNQITTAIQAASNAQLERGRAALISNMEDQLRLAKEARERFEAVIAEARERCDTWKHVALKADHTGQVRQFMAKFQQHIGEAPGWPPQEVLDLRVKLIAEEFAEMLEAAGYPFVVQIGKHGRSGFYGYDYGDDVIFKDNTENSGKPDFPAFIDALLDLEYVTLGTHVSCGVDPQPIWDAVHASNMLKQPAADKFSKITKPDGWTSPDISGALREQGWGGAE